MHRLFSLSGTDSCASLLDSGTFTRAVVVSFLQVSLCLCSYDLLDLVYDEKDKRKAEDFLATLARERDYKRRRQTYRAKNVHITKRSAAEV